MATRRRVPKTPTPPVEQPVPERAPLAPFPTIDLFPTVIGSAITIQRIDSVLRSAMGGYRQPLVDLLNELLQRDPHAFAVLSQRIQTVAGGRIEVKPAKNVPKGRRKRAKALAKWCQDMMEQVTDLPKALSSLSWGTYYGVAALETQWGPTDDGYIRPLYLHFIHSRRLSYPCQDWKLHIVDNGFSIYDHLPGRTTNGLTGISLEDYPGKFIIHSPQLRADYTTREGLGIQIVYWMAMKGMAARGASTYVERYARPPTLAKYTTTDDKNKPRAAIKEDIALGEAVAKGIAAGTITGATMPDSIEVDIITPQSRSVTAPGLTHLDWLKYCDGQVALAVLLNSEISDGGAESGSRAKAEVLEKLLRAVFRFDAKQLGQTLKRDLIYWMVRYNFPEDLDICPNVDVLIDDEPAPGLIMELALQAATIGMPVDMDQLAAAAGLPLVPSKKNDEPRACVLSAPVLADDARTRETIRSYLDEKAVKEADDLKTAEVGTPGPKKGQAQKDPSGASKQPKHVNDAS